MAFGPITSWQMEKKCKQWQILFSSAPKSLWIVTAAIKFKDSCSMEGKPWQTWTTYNIKKQRHHFGNKGLYSQSYGFSSSHVWMWDWALKNWCFWTVLLEKTLVSRLDLKEIQPVNPKGNQPWIFIGMTDAETPIHGPPDAKNWHIGKEPDMGKIEDRRKRGKQRMRWLDDITNSWSLLKFMSIESVMPSSPLILCCPLLHLPPIPPIIRVFSNESTLRMRCP